MGLPLLRGARGAVDAFGDEDRFEGGIAEHDPGGEQAVDDGDANLKEAGGGRGLGDGDDRGWVERGPVGDGVEGELAPLRRGGGGATVEGFKAGPPFVERHPVHLIRGKSFKSTCPPRGDGLRSPKRRNRPRADGYRGGGVGGSGGHSNGSPPCDGGDAEQGSRRVMTMMVTVMMRMRMRMMMMTLLLLPPLLPPPPPPPPLLLPLGDSRAGWESSALASVLCGGVRVMARQEREDGTAGKPMARKERETVR